MEPTLQIYRAPSGEWAGVVCEDAEERARIAGCASPREVADTAREQWSSIRCTRHEQTPEKVVAALEGRFDATKLEPDEQELFDELCNESLELPATRTDLR